MENFNEGISGTASMTKSAFERSSSFVVVTMRCRIAAASSLLILSLETSFSKSLSVVY